MLKGLQTTIFPARHASEVSGFFLEDEIPVFYVFNDIDFDLSSVSHT